MMVDITKLMSMTEASRRLGVTRQNIEARVKRGTFPSVKIGSNHYIHEDDLGYAHRNRGGLKGESHPRAALREEDVRTIREERKQGVSLAELACRYNCSVQNISHIATGRAWRSIE